MAVDARKVYGLQKSFGKNHVLRGIDVALSQGTVTVLMGANGAGKSTLVKEICGHHRADGGSMMLATPIGIAAMMADSPTLFLSLISIFIGLMAALPACYSASLNLATPNELRGTGIAFFCGTSGLVGMSLGPMVMATASQTFFSENAIGAGIATVMGVCCPLAALLLLSGCKAMREAVTAQEM